MNLRIGVVGLGIMGSGIASNFLKNGYRVFVWNRTPAMADGLIARGAIRCTTPAEVARKVDVIFEVTANDASSQSVWLARNGILAGADSTKTLIECATVSIQWIDKLITLCNSKKLSFFDMAMTGGRIGAESGALTLLVGGNETTLHTLRPILAAIAKKVIYFGPQGQGMRYKLVLNFLQAVHIIGYGQAMKIAKTHRALNVLNFCKARKGQFQILIIYNTNRFARDTEEHLWLRRELRQIGILLKSSTERLGETPVDKFTETLFAAKNELDNEEKRQKSHDGLWKRVEQGLWPWPAPTGYKKVLSYDDELRPRIIDETCSWAITEIFKKYATGTVTKVQLAREYKSKNILNHEGRLIKFSPQLIDTILRNKYYSGWLDHKTKGEIKGLHTQLITKELFDKCQREVIEKSNNRAKYRLRLNPEFPLRHFARCSECNGYLTGANQKKRTAPLYWCYKKSCKLYNKTFRKKTVTDTFLNFLSKVKPIAKQR